MMLSAPALQERHEDLLARQSELGADDVRRRAPAAGQLAADAQQFIADAIAQSEQVTDPRERNLLRAWLRYWATFIYDWSGVFPRTDLRPAALTTAEPPGTPPGAPPGTTTDTTTDTTTGATTDTTTGAPSGATGAEPPTPRPDHETLPPFVPPSSQRGGMPRWVLWLAAALLVLLLLVWALSRVLSNLSAVYPSPRPTSPPALTVTPLPPATPDVESTFPPPTPTRLPGGAAPGEAVNHENISRVRELGRVAAHAGGALAVAFDPDRAEIATAGVDGMARFWASPSLALSRRLSDQPGWVRAVAWSPQGDDSAAWPLILTGGNDRILRAYDPESLQLFAEFRPSADNSGFVFAAAFSPDGRLIAAGYGDGLARVWDVGSGTEIGRAPPATGTDARPAQTPPGAAAVNDLAFSDGGDLALALNGEPGALVMDNTFTETLCALQTSPATAVAFSPDGARLAVGTERGTLALVATDSCRVTRELLAHEGGVTDVAFGPDGDWLVTSGRDGTLRIFSIEGRALAMLTVGAPVMAVAVEPEVGRIASVDADGQLILWGVPTE